MRYNFDLPELSSTDERRTLALSSSTPTEQLQWLPLQDHPVFAASASTSISPPHSSNRSAAGRNLMAWDGASRLYFWDLSRQCLHRISIQLGEPEPTSVLSASPSKVLQPDVELDFVVDRISISRNGSSLLLAGSNGLRVMSVNGHTSSKDSSIFCRTVSVGSEIYFNKNNAIRTLKVSWHPYSDTHLGILSSDSVFRLFDLSLSRGQPEQEYYLQPGESGRSKNASSIYPADFSFGGNHLWDRFSVFVVFSDGSVYILCPIVPFGSVCTWDSISEIYTDAKTFGLKSGNPRAVKNSSLAIFWLEETFPELARQSVEDGNQAVVRAQPFTIFDASISLQGPLCRICQGGEEDTELKVPEREGRAVSILYNSISKDSVLVTAWSSGQLQIDALADEIQPGWAVSSPPRIRFDNSDRVVAFAMICERFSSEMSSLPLDQSNHNLWSGLPPPLLRLAIVDLALTKTGEIEHNYHVSIFVDPSLRERIFCVHDGGVDSLVLHFLPFTDQLTGSNKAMRSPSVHSVINTCYGESAPLSPLCAFLAISDRCGYSWVVGLTSAFECVVLEMETWNLSLHDLLEREMKPTRLDEAKDVNGSSILSKDLLGGPKVVIVPPSSSTRVKADSIEGRSMLHQYFNLFHENYVEYAHKVYFELKHHAPELKNIIDDQHTHLREVENKLIRVEEKQEDLENRIHRATRAHSCLEERFLNLKNLPGIHKKPLSKAERAFKMELDRFRGLELDALRSSIEAVSARLKRLSSSPHRDASNRLRQVPGRTRSYAHDKEISHLKSSIEKLSLINSENTNKVRLVESSLRTRESTG